MIMKKFDYSSLPLQSVICPVCKGNSFEKLASADRYRMGIITAGCTGCGLIMTNPRPFKEEIEGFYKNHYREYYQNIDYPSIEYIKRYQKHKRADYVTDFLHKNEVIPRKQRILDFGCAEGSLIKALKKYPALMIDGIEPNPSFASFAFEYTGCNIYSSLEALREASVNPYDLIIVNHVLEHMLDPVSFLKELGEFLNAQGLLFIDVPALENYKSVESLHIGHVFHFCRRSLEMITAVSGYSVNLIELHKAPQHPPSVRGLFRLDNNARIDRNTPEEWYWTVIKKIQDLSWRYYLMRSFPIRLILYIPRKITRLINAD